MECPPPPPAFVQPAPLDPFISLPQPTAEWLAKRDAYGDAALACYLERDAVAQVCAATLKGCRLDRHELETALRIEQARAREWQGIARQRPSWGLLAGVAVGSLVVGVVGWEALR